MAIKDKPAMADLLAIEAFKKTDAYPMIKDLEHQKQVALIRELIAL